MVGARVRLARFEIVRQVGAGGMGVVYEARDLTSGERLAIKTLHERDATALYRLKKEFRGLQGVVHPNLIAFRELFEENGAWYLVMDLVEGCNALHYVRASEGVGTATTVEALSDHDLTGARLGPISAPRDYERVRSVIAQIASALDHLHGSGRLHCDIKPGNVLVEPSGRVVVLDLGLARLAQPGASSTDGIAGTVPYISPEQVTGERPTAACDCYALGVVLFELLTGRWPFTGSAAQILHAKCSTEAPIGSLPASTPADLRELCAALLVRDPRQRPVATEVLHSLKVDVAPREPSTAAASFFGRERELDVLRTAVAAVREGHTRIVWIRGASGVGKSCLAEHFLDEQQRQPGTLALSSRCYEREDVPFKAVDGIIDALSTFLCGRDDAEVASFLPRHVSELCAAFPVLGRVPAIERVAADTRTREHLGDRRERAFAALREMLTRLGERRTVVLFIDDLQWGDADSMRLLRDVLRAPDAPPVLVVLTSRAEPTADTLVTRIEADPAVLVRLDTDVLTPAEATTLAAHLLAQAGIAEAGLANAIGQEANGHPLHILELASHAMSSPAEGAAVSLDDALAARLGRLTDRQRELLNLISLSAAPIAVSTLQRATASEASPLRADVTTLTGEHLLKSSAGPAAAVEAYHDRVREVVTARMGPSERSALHRRLALALEASDDIAPEILMLHFTGCDMPDRAAMYAARAARESQDRAAFDRAAYLYHFALRHGRHDNATRLSLTTCHAQTLASCGRPIDAARAFRSAAELATNDAERLDLERLMLEQLLFAGEFEQGWVAAKDLLARVGLRLADTRRGLIAAFLVERARIRLRGLRFSLRNDSEIDQRTRQRLDILFSLCSAMTFVNPIATRLIQARHLREALASGARRHVAFGIALEQGYAAFDGPRATRRVDKVYRIANTFHVGELATAAFAGFVEGGRGVSEYILGNFTNAIDYLDRAAPVIRTSPDMRWVDGICQAYRLSVLWVLGRYRQLVDEHAVGLKEAEEQGNVYQQRMLLSWRGNHGWLVRDDPATARADVTRAARVRAPGSQVQLPDYYDLLCNAMIDLYELDGARAFARIEESWTRIRPLRRIHTIDLESTYARGCAAIAAGTGIPGAVAIARASEKHLGKVGTPYSRLLAAQLRAAASAQQGNRKEAVASLETAIALADELDVRGHACAARMRLATLRDDETARQAADAAEAYLTAEGVVAPRRFASLLSPGLV